MGWASQVFCLTAHACVVAFEPMEKCRLTLTVLSSLKFVSPWSRCLIQTKSSFLFTYVCSSTRKNKECGYEVSSQQASWVSQLASFFFSSFKSNFWPLQLWREAWKCVGENIWNCSSQRDGVYFKWCKIRSSNTLCAQFVTLRWVSEIGFWWNSKALPKRRNKLRLLEQC